MQTICLFCVYIDKINISGCRFMISLSFEYIFSHGCIKCGINRYTWNYLKSSDCKWAWFILLRSLTFSPAHKRHAISFFCWGQNIGVSFLCCRRQNQEKKKKEDITVLWSLWCTKSSTWIEENEWILYFWLRWQQHLRMFETGAHRAKPRGKRK